MVCLDQLKKFMLIEKMDEDLTKEATTMLAESEKNLDAEVAPFIGEARSLKEGQDLKGAYEAYKKVLQNWPSHPEALKEVMGIKEDLDFRASKIYREALISESLSLFKDAEEKFQEVLQIAPNDSYYYLKTKDKLKKIIR
jgi:tetratricopeptide (TPR) repeat protein